MAARRLAVWPEGPSRALALALGARVEPFFTEPHEARAALDEGLVDLALLPTLEVLRAHDGLALVPGVALAGERSPRRTLISAAPLDAIRTVGFDPRDAQEALVAQLVLREHYGLEPVFGLADLAESPEELLAASDAALVPTGSPVPGGAYALDLGQEWTDLTLRPMVWGLLAARAGTLEPREAHEIAEVVRTAPPAGALYVDGVGVYQLTLDGYAADGLDQLAEFWFATGTLSEIPNLPFLPPPADPATAADPPEEDSHG
jgi:predicted solute-binding protein